MKGLKMVRLKKILAAAALLAVASFPAHAQWTGCGGGVGGSLIYGEAALGGPVGLGANGQKAGVTLNCDYKAGNFVIGAEANYDWVFGDLNTLGGKTEWSALGRLGVLTSPVNLLYGAAGYGVADFGPKVSSWKIGLGDEFKIPSSPFSLDLRVLYSRYDETDISPGLSGVKIDSLEGGIKLKVKFGPGMYGSSGSIFANDEPKAEPACDPKFANCPKKH